MHYWAVRHIPRDSKTGLIIRKRVSIGTSVKAHHFWLTVHSPVVSVIGVFHTLSLLTTTFTSSWSPSSSFLSHFPFFPFFSMQFSVMLLINNIVCLLINIPRVAPFSGYVCSRKKKNWEFCLTSLINGYSMTMLILLAFVYLCWPLLTFDIRWRVVWNKTVL